MSVVEGLKIQIHVCGTYVLSVWFTLLIGFGSVWIFSQFNSCHFGVLKKHLLRKILKFISCISCTINYYYYFKMSVSFRWSWNWLAHYLRWYRVQTIVPKDLTQKCSSLPLCTIILYYIMFYGNISFAIIISFTEIFFY